MCSLGKQVIFTDNLATPYQRQPLKLPGWKENTSYIGTPALLNSDPQKKKKGIPSSKCNLKKRKNKIQVGILYITE